MAAFFLSGRTTDTFAQQPPTRTLLHAPNLLRHGFALELLSRLGGGFFVPDVAKGARPSPANLQALWSLQGSRRCWITWTTLSASLKDARAPGRRAAVRSRFSRRTQSPPVSAARRAATFGPALLGGARRVPGQACPETARIAPRDEKERMQNRESPTVLSAPSTNFGLLMRPLVDSSLLAGRLHGGQRQVGCVGISKIRALSVGYEVGKFELDGKLFCFCYKQ